MLDGTLDVRRIKFFGTWRGGGQRRALNEFNKAPGKNGIALFTSDYGTSTPRISGSYSVVLSGFPASTPNTDIASTVASASQNGSVGIAPATAVLVARGIAATKLQAEAPVGTTVALRLILQPGWDTVGDAIGGGPVLVRSGRPVYRANEAFETSLLAPRHPRTAVGQTEDGRILLVTVDGRQSGYSVGMTTFEMAQALVRLGAVRGMQLDGGGSTTLAFDGTDPEPALRQDRASDLERADALLLRRLRAATTRPCGLARTETASRRSRRSRSRSCDRRTSP